MAAMRHISMHLTRASHRAARETERGELMRYFCMKLNPIRQSDGYPEISMSRMGKILEGIPTKDLYYIKRVCNDAPDFSKKFWWLLDPKKHPEEPNPQQ